MHVKTAFCHHSGLQQSLQDTTLMILLRLISLLTAARPDLFKEQQ
jgi:hypothetical protein